MSTSGALGGHARPTWAPSLRPASYDFGHMLLVVARPLLQIHLALYRRHIEHSPFPSDAPITTIPGDTPDQVLFIGDLGVSGNGVLHHGMTTVCITAGKVAGERLRGITWNTITSPDLTLHHAAHHEPLPRDNVDAVVLLLGVPDVLLGTTAAAWTHNLHVLIDRIREPSTGRPGTAPRIVIGAIPPMANFQPTHPVGHHLITKEVSRLNDASRTFAGTVPGVTFVPFPSWRVGDMVIRDHLSWATMHRLWACELAPHLINALDKHSPRPPAPLAR